MDVALTKLDNSDLLDTSILGQVVPLVENVADITHKQSTQLAPGQAVSMTLRLKWRKRQGSLTEATSEQPLEFADPPEASQQTEPTSSGRSRIKCKQAPLQSMDPHTNLMHRLGSAFNQLDAALTQLDTSNTLDDLFLAEIIPQITRAADEAQAAVARMAPGCYLLLLKEPRQGIVTEATAPMHPRLPSSGQILANATRLNQACAENTIDATPTDEEAMHEEVARPHLPRLGTPENPIGGSRPRPY